MNRAVNIKIRARFGSHFQEKSAMGSLSAMLSSWRGFYEPAHKNNKIDFDFEELEEVDRS